MIADAVRDVTSRNDIVLDAFSGSGTTIIACAKVGRRGYAVELDPHYVDVGVRRWEQWSGEVAQHAETGLTFAEMTEQRQDYSDRQTDTETAPAAEAALAVRVRQRPSRAALGAVP
jgi:tRNA/tmRNA/rRNA uracil-C5-methylase (TrmA/RlmC/RlmD family)